MDRLTDRAHQANAPLRRSNLRVHVPAVQKLWRRAPAAWRRRFWLNVHAARRLVLPLRVRMHWRRGGARSGAAVEVAGLFRDTRGVAHAARLFADALEVAGLPVHRSDAGATLDFTPVLDPPPRQGAAADEGVMVTCLNPPELLRWLDATGGRELRGRRHVGYWAWELSEAPPSWRAALRFVDEVWCHSEFAAKAIRRLARGEVPVRVLPLPVFVMSDPAPDRGRFALPENACVVLAVFDLRSSATRKNPLGALEAFIRARPQPGRDAILVCKVSGIEAEAQAARTLREAAADRGDIRLITELLPDETMRALTASCDVILSLHRAEGFGLMAAEAAWMGRPVVTTGWSAPLEFLTQAGAALVDYTLVPVADSQGQYGGAMVWAEPDLDDAAERLRKLIADPQARARMGAEARHHAERILGRDAWIAQAETLLKGAGRRPPPAAAGDAAPP